MEVLLSLMEAMKLLKKVVMSRKSRESVAEIDEVEFLVETQEKKVSRSK